MQINRASLAAAVLVATAGAPALAGAVAPGFGNLGTLPRCDDCFVGPVATGFGMNFFGTTFNQLYISNNGYVTFGAGQPNYTTTGLGTGYSGLPIIAAYFGDVDTRTAAGGSVTYGTGTFDSRAAFGVTWTTVGSYSEQTQKRNSFQMLLTNRSDLSAGDFDIYLNYDQIQWEWGSASGNVSAAVGFNADKGNAAGTFFEVAGSRVTGSFLDTGPRALKTGSNTGVPGQLRLVVRKGIAQVPVYVPPPPVLPPPTVPEPASWALLIIGFGAVGIAGRRRNACLTVRRPN